jgi:hypothetical protein
MSRAMTTERAERTEPEPAAPAEPRNWPRLALQVILGLSTAGFALAWLGAFSHGPDDFFAYAGHFLELTWFTILICLAGLAAGRRN